MSKVFSGIRPSGRLHLGNYLGAIKTWIEFQETHECIFGIVDYHAITTPFNPDELRANVREVALDYLAVGLDPKKAALIVQSQVPEHLELGWIFQSICPVSWFERVPTYKEKIAQHPDYVNLGLLAYPALMAADILIYKAEQVPVGEDQLPHIEMTNDIRKRFNSMFGETFKKVSAILGTTESARIMSLKDPSKKMSKTGDEGIGFADSPDEIRRKVMRAVTDSGEGIHMGGDKPALTNLLTIYSEVTDTPVEKLEEEYKGIGYAEFKRNLAEAIVEFLEPIQARRKALEKKKGYVEEVLAAGCAKARPIARKTLDEVKKKMGLV